jgi:dTDP-4-amino-4,6-dideoxygalactose transaminase
LLAGLKEAGIPAMIYYRRPLHEQPAYETYPAAGNGPIVSSRLSETVLSLPMHPYLTEEDQVRVAAAVREIL